MFLADNARSIVKLYYRPATGMSGFIDHGNWLFAGFLAIVVSAMVQLGMALAMSSAVPPLPAAQRRLQAARPRPGARPASPRPESTAQPAAQASPGADAEAASTGQGDDGDDDDDDDNSEASAPPSQLPSRGGPEGMAPNGAYPLPFRAGPSDLRTAIERASGSFFAMSITGVVGAVIGLAILYVPACILVMVVIGRPGSFGVVFMRDYVSLLTCTLMAWAAAHIPVAIALLVLAAFKTNILLAAGLWAAGKLYFAALMVFALRTAMGASFGQAIATVSVAWLSGLIEPILAESGLIYYLASPFLLIYLFMYLRGGASDLGIALGQRQGYRRYLESAMVNPHDAEAHYQLGLIYQRRHQYDEAVQSFRRAVAIDANEIDANYQLGILAREQGRPQQAIDCFGKVVAQNDKHSLSEVWREIGATYAGAGMLDEARDALEKFVERRPYDAEGLYLLGDCLQKRGSLERAREMYARCIEAARTTAYYRRGEVRKWSRLAERQERLIATGTQDASA